MILASTIELGIPVFHEAEKRIIVKEVLPEEFHLHVLAAATNQYVVPLYPCSHWRLLVMPRKEGDLFDYLCNNPMMGSQARIQIISQVCDALARLPDDFIYFDIKLENVLYDHDAGGNLCIYLTDFGRGTTLLFSPIETFRGQSASPKTMSYALGLMAFVFLHGVYPFPQLQEMDLEGTLMRNRYQVKQLLSHRIDTAEIATKFQVYHEEYQFYYPVIDICLQQDATRRPSCNVVSQMWATAKLQEDNFKFQRTNCITACLGQYCPNDVIDITLNCLN